MMRNTIGGMYTDYDINMDQTPISYSFHALPTLEKKEVKTEEGSKDSTCPVFNYGHKMHNTCGNSVSKWKVVAPYADFQGENRWMN
jgi:hypothetical protein